MPRFAVQWGNGKTTEIETESDCSTADQYAMQRWGQGSAQQVFDDYGVRIELIDESNPAMIKFDEVTREKAAVAAKTDSILANKAQVAAPKS